MTLSGVGAAHVPVGTYDITVSRGPEWDIQTRRAEDRREGRVAGWCA